MKDEIGEHFKEIENFEQLKIIIEDYMDYYNNERYQYNLAKLSPNEFYEYYQTGDYPIKEYINESVKIIEKIRKAKEVQIKSHARYHPFYPTASPTQFE